MYIYVTIDEKRGHESEREQRGVWERGKGRKEGYNYIIISKIKLIILKKRRNDCPSPKYLS